CQELSETAMQLIRTSYGYSRPIRAITVTAANLVPCDEIHEQLDIFGESGGDEKQEALEGALADIRKKFGNASIHLGAYENEDLGIGAYGKRHAHESGQEKTKNSQNSAE
ncbi:MAG: hypothetical protein J6B77_08020, partial [Clostridia bacterium]|nr:hypothetical protein [Clostridia bacterium]